MPNGRRSSPLVIVANLSSNDHTTVDLCRQAMRTSAASGAFSQETLTLEPIVCAVCPRASWKVYVHTRVLVFVECVGVD